jgi:hypothetical protein
MKKMILFTLLLTASLQANAQSVERREVLNCNNGELRVLLESGEYGRHQVVVRDQYIWDMVVQNYFETSPCSVTDNDPSSTPVCKNAQGEFVVYSHGGNGWEIYKDFNWLNSVTFMEQGDRIFEMTWFKNGEGVQFEVMSNKRIVSNCGPTGEGPCEASYVDASKIVRPNADWFFRNCKVLKPFKNFQ